jgi:MFS superfamily sulfate permease-like transporter
VSAVPKALLQQLVMWLILGLLCAALLLVLGWCTGSGHAWPAWVPLVALSLFAVAVLALDQTWLGLHPFYRRRHTTSIASGRP